MDMLSRALAILILTLTGCSAPTSTSNGITDPVLAACVEMALLESGSKELTSIKELVCKGIGDVGVKSLAGINALSGLEKLQLQNNQLNSLAGMGALPSLKVINLSGNNKLISLEGIEGAENLEEIHATRAGQLADISAISGLYKLKTFGVMMNNISDVSAFQDLANIEKVVINYNNITDISAFRNKPKLTWFELHYNPISSIEPLLTNGNMKLVGFSRVVLEDCSDVEKLKKLLADDARIFAPQACS